MFFKEGSRNMLLQLIKILNNFIIKTIKTTLIMHIFIKLYKFNYKYTNHPISILYEYYSELHKSKYIYTR